MTIMQPRRLRTDSMHPEALREALRELPNAAPEPSQLAELRRQLGIAAPRTEEPVPAVLVPDRRLKERQLRRTVVALVFFPIAATAAVGVAVDLYQRSAASATTEATVALGRSHARQVAVRPSARPAIAPTNTSEKLPAPTAPEPEASALRLPRAAPSSALVSRHSEPSSRAIDPINSAASVTEVELLQRANAALKGDPALAQVLASEHRQRFPAGNLAQEREVIAIKALLALGDQTSAKESLARFQRAYPRSAHALELSRIVH